MDRKEREAVLGEWGVRDPSVREQAERTVLEQDLEGSPLRGKPLARRLRNFRPAVDRYVVSLGGPLPYMRRLRQIELETEEHERRLAEAWRDLAESCSKEAGRFANRWRRLAQRQSFDAVNELIMRHNLYYPAEARLPMDVVSGDFVLVGGRPYRREPLGPDWVLERFPPDITAAREQFEAAVAGRLSSDHLAQAPEAGLTPSSGPDACHTRSPAFVSMQYEARPAASTLTPAGSTAPE